MLAGRSFGKTRTGAEWIRYLAEAGQARRIALVARSRSDARKVMIEGKSGILAISDPRFRPVYKPSNRQLTWPNGVIATTYSAEKPDELRGPEHDAAWADEMASWQRPETWSNLQLGLRIGDSPRVCVTTTPRPTKLVRDLMTRPSTRMTRGSTYENADHVAEDFLRELLATYEGTRLGLQEIHAEVLDISEGAWFPRFDPARHVSELADYHPGFPVHLAIDCGVSRHAAAVWFQVRPLDPRDRMAAPPTAQAILTPRGYAVPPVPVRPIHDYGPRRTITVFGDWHAEDLFSHEAAAAIRAHGGTLPGAGGRPDTVRLDPAASARSGIGPAAFGEFARTFGETITAAWPRHRVGDGLDHLGVLLETGSLAIHPRCLRIRDAFQNYRRAKRGGEWLDEPEDPQHPHEDLMDALRGGVRDRFPEGRVEQPDLRRVHA